ncbi:hypothetical protein GCM10023264_07680 [Sphingomonas daechungensis]|uniref:TetR-like C-terminal domain-containing protein n=1 Tax=Sphingomonas daechungensis TaxID=1176646 RepID=UPI0031EA0341
MRTGSGARVSGELKERQPLIRPERYGFFDKLLFAVFVLAVPPFIASNWSVFRDGDVSWHIAAGRWIIEHHYKIPRTDPFSFTMAGKPWIAFEWGAELILAGAYNLAGFAGLAALVALALMALFGTLFWYLRDKAGPVALLVAFAATYLVLQPFIMARPHVLTWPFLALWAAVMFRYRDAGRAPPLAWALFIVLWANIHGSYFAGFLVSAACGLDAWIDARFDRKVFIRWLVFGIAILLAAMLNAYGVKGVLYPLEISSMTTLLSIGEWQASNPSSTPIFYGLLIGVLGALLAKRPQFRPGELALLLLTLLMAFTHIRHQSVFIILSAMIVTPKLAGPGRKDAPPTFASNGEKRLWLGAAAVAALPIVGVRAMIPLQPRETFSNPRGLIAHIPPELRDQPVLNEYSMGGPLILSGVKVFIDGRADMYGDDYFKTYLKMNDGDWDAFTDSVRKYGFRWTMLQKGNRLVEKLDASPDWRRVYSDEVGVIHVRRDQPLAAPAQPVGNADAKEQQGR